MDGSIDVLHTYQCDEMQDTYTGTTRIIPDHKCPGEDRILVCELEGYVTSNINIQTRLDLLTIAFLKTYQNENVRTILNIHFWSQKFTLQSMNFGKWLI